jgi:hypothetical protein
MFKSVLPINVFKTGENNFEEHYNSHKEYSLNGEGWDDRLRIYLVISQSKSLLVGLSTMEIIT